MDALLASGTLLEPVLVLTLTQEMAVERLNLDDLVTMSALSEHRAVLPVVVLHLLGIRKRLVNLSTELTGVALRREWSRLRGRCL